MVATKGFKNSNRVVQVKVIPMRWNTWIFMGVLVWKNKLTGSNIQLLCIIQLVRMLWLHSCLPTITRSSMFQALAWRSKKNIQRFACMLSHQLIAQARLPILRDKDLSESGPSDLSSDFAIQLERQEVCYSVKYDVTKDPSGCLC
jgi:hypothetical protein